MEGNPLAKEVKFLKGVGPRGGEAFAKLGVRTVGDLLHLFPRRHQDRRNLPPIARAEPGQWVTVRGRLREVGSRPTRGGMVIVKAILDDGSGRIALTWFNSPWTLRALQNVTGEIIAYGMVKESGYDLEIAGPEWEPIGEEEDADGFARLVPVYPATSGLGQTTIRRAVKQALAEALHALHDPLPAPFRRERALKDLQWSVEQMHYPESEPDRLEARKRLVFEEFLYMQLALALRRAETNAEPGIAFPIEALKAGEGVEAPIRRQISVGAHGRTVGQVVERRRVSSDLFATIKSEIRDDEPLRQQVDRMLPFHMTGAQARVVEEIWSDMARPAPMNRLVQGDVGAGKTAVAAAAMLAAIRSGYQAAMMAPTEILAEQHFGNLRRLFNPLGVETDLLIGRQGSRDRKAALQRVKEGYANLVVGTHALIQEGVEFAQLGLAVIDEQHRFGVLQRKALREKGLGNPDILVMTATPIPRTLTMTLHGDLDVSVIDELPPGRKPIKTHWKLPEERPAVYAGVERLLSLGQQAYFVCPLVGETEKVAALAATELYEYLQGEVFPNRRVGLLHGQMKGPDKDAVMDAFRAHELDILVSTTVIEVGVDVPNASIMVIEDADRFGLAQLHQLRGRVGRGANQSFCVLVASTKSEETSRRLDVMVETTDGFRISEADLEIRGPGNMAGTEQSGRLDFKVADLIQDAAMLEIARAAAFALIEDPAELRSREWELAMRKVAEQRSGMALVAIS